MGLILNVREVVLISVGEISMKTADTIKNKVWELCIKHRVKCEVDDKRALWGAKVVVVFNGEKDIVGLIVKLLKIDFKVKYI